MEATPVMEQQDVRRLNDLVARESVFVEQVLGEIRKVIVGQKALLEKLLIGLLADGHLLLEGVPGLAKTLSVKTLSDIIDLKFQRIQFTPDLLPADLIGTMIFNQKDGQFVARKGPLFTNIVLADEINRAPAKVQSALLEAMQERQVTIGDTSYQLDRPFLVLATQNPIEQEGTYPLPEAQVDRFMLKIKVDYPSKAEEREILERMSTLKPIAVRRLIRGEDILKARDVVSQVYVDARIKDYIVDMVLATRRPEEYKLDVKGLVQFGASPRATVFLTLAAKAHAFLRGRGYVTPEDVKSIAFDVLRHRIILSYEAEAEDVTTEQIIQKVLDTIEVP
ncbi:MAG TPA: AAA family ATPase [Candidatus Polarisedimenticolia bacterium]|jgi:MoxR-like ATPase|nr:AAA family ATPase [Candidatus Polarisedimenticolia bacterium]